MGPTRRGTHFGLAVGDQRVEMAADGGARQVQRGRDRDGRDRPLLHEQARHRLPRAELAFHNTSVAYLVATGKGGSHTVSAITTNAPAAALCGTVGPAR